MTKPFIPVHREMRIVFFFFFFFFIYIFIFCITHVHFVANLCTK